MKIRGPKIETWGMPHLMGVGDDEQIPILTFFLSLSGGKQF